MTNDYLNEFTPDWPHGHVVVLGTGRVKVKVRVKPFTILTTSGPGEFPIWGHIAGEKHPLRFSPDGNFEIGGVYRLRNVAPPKRKPREVWVNYYPNDISGPFASREVADGIAKSSSMDRIECIHFREVIEETKAKPEEGKRLPENFDLDAARKALVNPPMAYCAFRWASTSQGSDFWLAYFNEKLSPEDTAIAHEALRRWIAIAERGASK